MCYLSDLQGDYAFIADSYKALFDELLCDKKGSVYSNLYGISLMIGTDVQGRNDLFVVYNKMLQDIKHQADSFFDDENVGNKISLREHTEAIYRRLQQLVSDLRAKAQATPEDSEMYTALCDAAVHIEAMVEKRFKGEIGRPDMLLLDVVAETAKKLRPLCDDAANAPQVKDALLKTGLFVAARALHEVRGQAAVA